MTVVAPTSGNSFRPVMRYAAPPPIEARPDDFDLSAGFRLIRRRFRSIALVTLILVAAMAPAILSMKPVYHAESRIMIRSSPPPSSGSSEFLRNDPVDLPSETERLLSRRMAERVIRELNLSSLEAFNPSQRPDGVIERLRQRVRAAIDRHSEPRPSPAEDPMEAVVQRFYQALSIRRDGASNVVQIGFDAQDPLLAAAVPAKILEVYRDERAEIARRDFEAAERFVEQRIAERQRGVDSAREAVRRYREAVGPVSNEAQAEQARLVADLSDRYRNIGQRQEDMQASIAALQATGRAGGLEDVVGVPDSLLAMQRDIAGQQGALDLLLKTYGENADPVIDLRAKLAAMTASLGVEVDRFVQSQRARLAALGREKDETWNALTAARDKLAQSAVAQTELEGLLGKADTEQAALDKFEQDRRSMADQAAMPMPDDVEVLSPAAVPLGPQGKSRLFYLLGALLVSASVSITIAFLREMLDRTVRSHQQLAGISGLVPAGLLPLARRSRSVAWPATTYSQNGLFGEAVRSVMVSLRQSTGGRLPDSILVASALDGEGKSFVARSLALELVAAGQPVLLVDCDLVRGDLGAFLRAGDKPGLNEWLSGGVDLADIIHRHEKSGIDFIPRGNVDRARRFHLPDLQAIIQHAQDHGQVVVVDSAPVLASTDTIHLAGQVERVLIVVRWGRTQLRAIEYATQRLRETSHGEMLVALNKVDPRRYKLYGFKDSELFLNSMRKYHIAR